MKAILFVCLCCAFVCNDAVAQSSVSGQVNIFETQEPISGLNVVLSRESTNGIEQHFVQTDQSGHYEFPEVRPGAYTMTVDYTQFVAGLFVTQSISKPSISVRKDLVVNYSINPLQPGHAAYSMLENANGDLAQVRNLGLSEWLSLSAIHVLEASIPDDFIVRDVRIGYK